MKMKSNVSISNQPQNTGVRGTSDMNIMEKLILDEDDQKKSVLFASKAVLIRNNAYYIMGRVLKVRRRDFLDFKYYRMDFLWI